jgi:hypothetical protein
MTTVHANSPRDSLARIETMVLMAGIELPVRAIREQTAAAVDLIIHQTRLKDGSRRVTHITEVIGLEGDVIALQDLFLFDFRAGIDAYGRYRGTLQPTGLRPMFLDRLNDAGIAIPLETFTPAPPPPPRANGHVYGNPAGTGDVPPPGFAGWSSDPLGNGAPPAEDAIPSWFGGSENRNRPERDQAPRWGDS